MRTITWYFINLVSFILVLLLYYGLIIVLGITMCIHFYDYVYNYEEFLANWNTKDPSLELVEFQSSKDYDKHH